MPNFMPIADYAKTFGSFGPGNEGFELNLKIKNLFILKLCAQYKIS